MRKFARRNVRRSAGQRPSREWVSLNVGWTFSMVAVTTATPLMQLQAPTTLNLTSDPPEDLTVLRVVGDFNATVNGLGGSWTLALMVQDTTWTPSALWQDDADKRILWSQTYTDLAAMGGSIWAPPGILSSQASILPAHPTNVRVDITPKVKLEAGKALYLVAYEQAAGAVFSTAAQTVRLLYQRSGRR